MALPAFKLSECVVTPAIDTDSNSGGEKCNQRRLEQWRNKKVKNGNGNEKQVKT